MAQPGVARKWVGHRPRETENSKWFDQSCGGNMKDQNKPVNEELLRSHGSVEYLSGAGRIFRFFRRWSLTISSCRPYSAFQSSTGSPPIRVLD